MNRMNRHIGNVIKVMRTAAGMKQKDLALRAGIKPNYLSLVEAGKREPSLKILREIAKALDVPTSLLFWESEEIPGTVFEKEGDQLLRLKRLVLEMETIRLANQKRAV